MRPIFFSIDHVSMVLMVATHRTEVVDFLDYVDTTSPVHHDPQEDTRSVRLRSGDVIVVSDQFVYIDHWSARVQHGLLLTRVTGGQDLRLLC